MYSDSVIKRVIELRKEKGLTQEQLADRLGVHPSLITDVETKTVALSHKFCKKLAKFYRVSSYPFGDPLRKEV